MTLKYYHVETNIKSPLDSTNQQYLPSCSSQPNHSIIAHFGCSILGAICTSNTPQTTVTHRQIEVLFILYMREPRYVNYIPLSPFISLSKHQNTDLSTWRGRKWRIRRQTGTHSSEYTVLFAYGFGVNNDQSKM